MYIIYQGGEDTSSLKKELALWAVKCQTPHSHINKLLTLLKKYLPGLPSDARTLLSTPRHVPLEVMAPGLYHHFGLNKCINNALYRCNFLSLNLEELQLFIGIDGTPTAKSIREEFWLILGELKNVGLESPFVVGIYAGPSKPANANEF